MVIRELHVAHVHLVQLDLAAELLGALGRDRQHARGDIGADQFTVGRVVWDVQASADTGFQHPPGNVLANRLAKRALADDFRRDIQNVKNGRDAFVFIARAGVHELRLLGIEVFPF